MDLLGHEVIEVDGEWKLHTKKARDPPSVFECPAAHHPHTPKTSLLINQHFAELMHDCGCRNWSGASYSCTWHPCSTSNTRFYLCCNNCGVKRVWSVQGEDDQLDNALLMAPRSWESLQQHCHAFYSCSALVTSHECNDTMSCCHNSPPPLSNCT